MKIFSRVVLQTCFGTTLFLSGQASARTLYWEGGDAHWSSETHWSNFSGFATPGVVAAPNITDLAVFNINNVNNAQVVSLNGPEAALGLAFNSTGGTTLNVDGDPTGKTLTLGDSGIFVTEGVVTISIPAGIILMDNQAWTNISTNLLTISTDSPQNINNGGFRLTIDGTGDSTINSIIGGAGGLTKNDAGTLTLSGSSTYGGSTIVNGGTLALGTSNVLPDNSAVVLDGGNLSTNADNTDTTGTLQLLSSSTISNGSGLSFANSAGTPWEGSSFLTLVNWTSGSLGIRFGTDQNGLSSTQLSQISVYYGPGLSNPAGPASLDANGYLLVAVPEPGAVIAGMLLLGGIGWRERRHFLRQRPLA